MLVAVVLMLLVHDTAMALNFINVTLNHEEALLALYLPHFEV